MDFRSIFAGLALLAAIIPGLRVSAQDLPDSVALKQVPDTLIIEPTLEDLLRAKVDSLRGSMAPAQEEAPPSLSTAEWLQQADSLRLEYRFAAAIEALDNARAAGDTLSAEIDAARALVRNARTLMDYCPSPTVVARRIYPLSDFLMHCPMPGGSWRRFAETMVYAPSGSDVIYFTQPDADGVSNIVGTVRGDSLWSAPRLINESLTSPQGEIFPMLSRDGRTLYFASRGLYGMGGYDLYASHWNRERRDWDAPVNLGFPYSSPYDDYLFYNTDDGRYSVLASNRGCPRDSVCIFVLEYDAMPMRRAIHDEDELRRLAALEPQDLHAAPDDGDDGQMDLYMSRMSDVRRLRDSLSAADRTLSALRQSLATAPPDEVADLASRILDGEARLKTMRSRLDQASKALQETEMQFLASGVASRVQAVARQEFTFPNNRPGAPLTLEFEPRKTSAIQEFSIDEKAEVVAALPDGLVYQIEFAADVDRMDVPDMCGLSPVYEKMAANLKFTYTAGLFPTYADALAQLNRVRRLGFSTARIVAFRDGAAVDVDSVREIPAWSVELPAISLPSNYVESTSGTLLR